MTTKQILELEDANLQFNTIHLIKEGLFWRAYERSAYLFSKHFWVDITVNGGYVKSVERDVHYVGFPDRSLQKVLDKLPEAGNSRVVERSETKIRIDDVPPIEGFEQWKEGLALLRKQATEQMQPYYGKLPLYKAVYDHYFQTANLVRNFPRDAQYTLGEKILKYGLRLNLTLYRMMQSQKKGYQDQVMICMGQVDEIIENLRFLLRISYDMQLFNVDRFSVLSESFESIRKQLSGWYKKMQSEASVQKSQTSIQQLTIYG